MNDNTERGVFSRIHAISNILITIIALIFTVLYQQKQNQILETQVTISKATLVGNLIPLLTSEKPKERILAFEIIRDNYPLLTIPISKDFIINNPTKELQNVAEKNIRDIIKEDVNETTYRSAKIIIDIVDVLNELKEKRLLGKLQDANAYARGRNRSGEEKAFHLYTKVLQEMSPEGIDKLDKNLLDKAKADIGNGDIGEAILKYRLVFSDFL